MRVITGSARGTRLDTVPGLDVRPTFDRVKEGAFSALHFALPGAHVLDLFAGSGQLGIEALSRGAERCVFVDSDRRAQKVIIDNLSRCKLRECARVVLQDSLEYLRRCKDRFDIVFLDPPYDSGLYEEALAGVEPLLNDDGLAICESDRALALPESVGTLEMSKQRRYGKTIVTTYRKVVEKQ